MGGSTMTWNLPPETGCAGGGERASERRAGERCRGRTVRDKVPALVGDSAEHLAEGAAAAAAAHEEVTDPAHAAGGNAWVSCERDRRQGGGGRAHTCHPGPDRRRRGHAGCGGARWTCRRRSSSRGERGSRLRNERASAAAGGEARASGGRTRAVLAGDRRQQLGRGAEAAAPPHEACRREETMGQHGGRHGGDATVSIDTRRPAEEATACAWVKKGPRGHRQQKVLAVPPSLRARASDTYSTFRRLPRQSRGLRSTAPSAGGGAYRHGVSEAARGGLQRGAARGGRGAAYLGDIREEVAAVLGAPVKSKHLNHDQAERWIEKKKVDGRAGFSREIWACVATAPHASCFLSEETYAS